MRPIALLGFMGSGKTTAGRALAERLDLDFTDLDTEIEESAGMTVAEIFDREGEPAFRRLEGAHLGDVLLPNSVVALGGGTVVDDRNWALVRAHARSIWLDAPAAALWDRVGDMRGRPLVSDRLSFEALLAARRSRYAQADIRVDASRPFDEVVEQLVTLCRK
jgi:shikimate kinase